MTRTLRRLGLLAGAAALGVALAVGLGGCPYMHDSYPPASNACTIASDCFCGETCSDGLCVTSDAGCQVDAAPTTTVADGGHRG
jgi:hypothetical protein